MRRLTVSAMFLMLFSMWLASPLAAQTIVVNNSNPINFQVQAGASSTQSVSVSVTPAASYSVITLGNPPWLSATKVSETQASVTVNTAGLDPANSPYSGTLIFSAGSQSIAVAVNLTLSSTAGSQVIVSTSGLTFNYQFGSGSSVASQYFTVGSTTSNPVTFSVTVSSPEGWLTSTTLGGNTATNNLVEVKVNPGTLAIGPHDGIITITPTNVGFAPVPVQIPVRLNVTGAAQLVVDKTALSFPWQTGTTLPATQTIRVTVSNSDQQVPVSATIDPSSDLGGSWLVVTAGSSFTPADVQVSISPSILSTLLPKKYSARVIITPFSSSLTAISVPVTLTVSQLPLLLVTPASLQFTMPAAGAPPASQKFTAGSTSAQLAFTSTFASANGNWVTLNPATGLTASDVQVSVNSNAQSLPAGTYTGTITVQPNNGTDAQTIAVTLTVVNTAVLTTSPSAFNFVYQTGKLLPNSQPLAVGSTGAAMKFSAAASTSNGGNWLALFNPSGTLLSPTDQLNTGNTIAVGVYVTSLSPGTYTGSILLTPQGSSSPTVTIPVTLQVSDKALLQISPAEIAVTFLPGGSTTSNQTIAVNTTSDPVTFGVSFVTNTGVNWLLASTTSGSSGTTPSNVSVYINAGGLSAGIYTGAVTITPTNGGPAQTVPVKVTVSAGTLSVSPTSLTFTQASGGAAPAAQQLSITNSTAGASPLPFSLSVSSSAPGGWLNVDKTSGTTPSTVNVSVTTAGLAAGTYTGSITITSPGASGSPQIIGVTLNVTPAQTFSLSANVLNFSGSAAQLPAAQSVTVSSTASGLTFTAAASTDSPVGVPWLAVTPTSGNINNTPLSISIVPAELAKLSPGTYTGSVRVTVPGATNSPQTINVTLSVTTLPIVVPTTQLNFTGSVLQTPSPQAVAMQSSTAGLTFRAVAATTTGGNWLAVNPGEGTFPATLSVSIVQSVLTGLTPGTYNGSITVTVPNTSISPQVIPVVLTVVSVAPTITKVVNAASYLATPIAGGEILYIEGVNMGPADIAIAPGTPFFSTFLQDVRVLFDGVPAPIIYVQQKQISVVAPWSVNALASTKIQVEYKGQRSDARELRVGAVAPGIFSGNSSGTGQGAILNQDNSYNGVGTFFKSAAKGSVVQVFGTGGGVTNPAGIDGTLTPPILTPILANYSALVGGIPATVQYAGGAPNLISGLLQVNVQIPDNAPSGPDVPIVILIGGIPTQAGITVAIQ